MDKSKWDSHDWRDWLDSQSEDSVVTELKCQYDELVMLRALVREAEPYIRAGASRATYNEPHDLHFCAECGEEWGCGHDDKCSVGKAQEILSRPEIQAITEEKP